VRIKEGQDSEKDVNQEIRVAHNTQELKCSQRGALEATPESSSRREEDGDGEKLRQG